MSIRISRQPGLVSIPITPARVVPTQGGIPAWLFDPLTFRAYPPLPTSIDETHVLQGGGYNPAAGASTIASALGYDYAYDLVNGDAKGIGRFTFPTFLTTARSPITL